MHFHQKVKQQQKQMDLFKSFKNQSYEKQDSPIKKIQVYYEKQFNENDQDSDQGQANEANIKIQMSLVQSSLTPLLNDLQQQNKYKSKNRSLLKSNNKSKTPQKFTPRKSPRHLQNNNKGQFKQKNIHQQNVQPSMRFHNHQKATQIKIKFDNVVNSSNNNIIKQSQAILNLVDTNKRKSSNQSQIKINLDPSKWSQLYQGLNREKSKSAQKEEELQYCLEGGALRKGSKLMQLIKKKNVLVKPRSSKKQKLKQIQKSQNKQLRKSQDQKKKFSLSCGATSGGFRNFCHSTRIPQRKSNLKMKTRFSQCQSLFDECQQKSQFMNKCFMRILQGQYQDNHYQLEGKSQISQLSGISVIKKKKATFFTIMNQSRNNASEDGGVGSLKNSKTKQEKDEKFTSRISDISPKSNEFQFQHKVFNECDSFLESNPDFIEIEKKKQFSYKSNKKSQRLTQINKPNQSVQNSVNLNFDCEIEFDSLIPSNQQRLLSDNVKASKFLIRKHKKQRQDLQNQFQIKKQYLQNQIQTMKKRQILINQKIQKFSQLRQYFKQFKEEIYYQLSSKNAQMKQNSDIILEKLNEIFKSIRSSKIQKQQQMQKQTVIIQQRDNSSMKSKSRSSFTRSKMQKNTNNNHFQCSNYHNCQKRFKRNSNKGTLTLSPSSKSFVINQNKSKKLNISSITKSPSDEAFNKERKRNHSQDKLESTQPTLIKQGRFSQLFNILNQIKESINQTQEQTHKIDSQLKKYQNYKANNKNSKNKNEQRQNVLFDNLNKNDKQNHYEFPHPQKVKKDLRVQINKQKFLPKELTNDLKSKYISSSLKLANQSTNCAKNIDDIKEKYGLNNHNQSSSILKEYDINQIKLKFQQKKSPLKINIRENNENKSVYYPQYLQDAQALLQKQQQVQINESPRFNFWEQYEIIRKRDQNSRKESRKNTFGKQNYQVISYNK